MSLLSEILAQPRSDARHLGDPSPSGRSRGESVSGMRAGPGRMATLARVERLTTWERLRGVNPYVWDALLALVVFGVSVLAGSSISDGSSSPVGEPIPESRLRIAFHAGTGALLIIAAACAPLVWRRRAPLTTLCATSIAVAVYQLGGFPDGLVAFPLIVAAYSVAAHRERGPHLVVAFFVTLAAGLMLAFLASDPRGRIEVSFILLVTTLPMLFGRIAFNRRRRIERDRERAARDAVSEERGRIAREMHDAVAHAMTVMVVQAGGARSVIDRDPAGAVDALRRIEDTGRSGLGEMRRLIGVLAPNGEVPIEPQPGLDRLDELLDTMRATGLPVETVVEGEPRGLPPGVDLTAYRLVQEALTNALKHAGDAHASVVLRYRDDALELEVADDGRGTPVTDAGGRGLVGMRERIALFGGSLETGPRPGGGFSVRARIPTAEAR
jgi:signal transduction histidine kinase